MQTLTSVTTFLTPVLHCWIWTESIVVPLLTHINWRDICAGWTQRSRCYWMHNLRNAIPISLNAIDYSISIILKEAIKKSIVVNLSLSSKKLFCTTHHCHNFLLICPSQDFFWQQKYKKWAVWKPLALYLYSSVMVATKPEKVKNKKSYKQLAHFVVYVHLWFQLLIPLRITFQTIQSP